MRKKGGCSCGLFGGGGRRRRGGTKTHVKSCPLFSTVIISVVKPKTKKSVSKKRTRTMSRRRSRGGSATLTIKSWNPDLDSTKYYPFNADLGTSNDSQNPNNIIDARLTS